ncbi:hypothetical protein [Paracoccus fistulariae]|uniref:DUF4149 domain-containing protein n=1 Tax=Paracoccus fistulariae TaxID=658446 RepID=A0ABY7SGG0_9RHOB|nr:hypothetical protein [Paracoccus fistulariae]MDB6181738.1 hypothetical protein [Paracoccus fistulariae]WCR05964.1 hypothetical protein JHX87_10575 [Paracoccus fistulariae]
MKDSQIVAAFVGISVAIWLLLALAIFLLPTMGYPRSIVYPLQAHPVALVMAAFPLISIYVKKTDQPVTYRRALKLSVLALVFLLPLYVLSDSLNIYALVSALDAADAIPQGQRNYIIYTPRGIGLTIFGTLLGLGYVFPAQVKVRQRAVA